VARRRTFKYLLRPNATQARELAGILALCRELYNAGLQEKRDAYKRQGINLSRGKQSSELTALKEASPEHAEVYAQVLQDVFVRLHRAFDAFFRRVKTGRKPGYPRFKSADRYDSFMFPQVSRKSLLKRGGVERLANNRLRVHGLTGELKVVWHREFKGIPKTATFKREGARWYLVLSCDEVPLEEREKTGASCGVDVGLEAFATLDDGTRVENPRLLAAAQRKIVGAQRKVSRRKKGSARRRKARALLAAQHRRVANARRDFHHKTARALVRAHDRIAVEDLNVAGLARGFLSKQVHDVGWAQFLNILGSKAEGAGVEVVRVAAAGTSQECSACGATTLKDLKERTHRCQACGFTAHRDVNAALNIRQRAFGHRPGSGRRGGAPPGVAWYVACDDRASDDPRSPVL
jgi:putative transposase